MPGSFKHPLARVACLRPAVSLDGAERLMLVIATTLELDRAQKDYKKTFVDRLSRAAKEHLSRFPNVSGFVLINRLRDWRL
jgi:hypothetical protein